MRAHRCVVRQRPALGLDAGVLTDSGDATEWGRPTRAYRRNLCRKKSSAVESGSRDLDIGAPSELETGRIVHLRVQVLPQTTNSASTEDMRFEELADCFDFAYLLIRCWLSSVPLLRRIFSHNKGGSGRHGTNVPHHAKSHP